jgi:CO/xanthine dehydrogenase Mo-binding subunit
MRGFAVTMATWAIEQQMDKIAEIVGLDAWAIRFINAYKDGDIKPHQKVVEDATLIEVMQAAAEMAGVNLPEVYKQMRSMEVGHG